MRAHDKLVRIEGWIVVEAKRLGAGFYFQRPIEDLRTCALPAGVTIDPAPPPPEDQICGCDGIGYRCILCGVSYCCIGINDDSVCVMCGPRLPPKVLRVMDSRARKGKRRGRLVSAFQVRDRPVPPSCLAA